MVSQWPLWGLLRLGKKRTQETKGFLLYPSGGPSGQIYLSMTSMKQNSAHMVCDSGPFGACFALGTGR